MKKIFSFLLLGLLLSIGNAWADQVTIAPTDFTATTSANYSTTKSGVTVAVTSSTVTADEMRVFKNQTITISSSNTITGITFTCTANGTAKYGPGCFAEQDGYTYDASGPTGTWTGSSNSVTFTASTNQVRISSIEITYSSGTPDPSVATTTTIDATGISNTDVYAGTAAGSLSATVKDNNSTTIDGAVVTWSGDNDAVATINATTGAVTLVAAGTVTFTASYAGVANQYKPSSKTYEMTVTDSTPFEGEIFDATIDKDLNNTTQGAGSITKNNVTYSCTSGVLGNGSEYRMYKNSTTTISTTDGSHITKIEFLGVSGNPASGFADQTGWTTSGNDGVWEGDAESVAFTASGAQVRATKIKVTVVANANPSISADNVNVAYDATAGSITYTINNPVVGGVLTASIAQGNWLTLGAVGATIPLTFEANPTANARIATITLTYTYNTSEEVSKNVTITQAGNPNVFDNISDITEVGTAYKVKGTVVATNAKGLIIGDGTGYVYYYKGSAPTQAIGDKVTISGTTATYGQIIQYNSTAAITTAASSSYDNTPVATVIYQVPDYSEGYHLSTYVQFEGILDISNNNYFVTVQGTNIQISYPTDAQKTTMDDLDGKVVKVKGYFSGINSNSYFTVMLQSVGEKTITLGANGYSTFAADFKYTVSGAEVYKAAYNEQQNAIVLTEVENAVVPANAGIILKGTEGDVVTITPSNAAASDFAGNELVGVLAPTEAEANWYVLATNIDGDGLTKFHNCYAGIEIPANKACIEIGATTAPSIRIIEAGNEATNIQNVEGAEKAVKFMENGKLYIQKNGVVYDAMGKTVR